MNIENRVRMAIGELVIQNEVLKMQIEGLQAQLAEPKKAAPVDQPEPDPEQPAAS